MSKSSNSAQSGSRGTIPRALIASADDKVVATTRNTLNGKHGIGIRTEPDGLEAIRLLEQFRYAAIVFDDSLKKMSAIEFAFYVSERASGDTHAIAVGTHPPNQSSVLQQCGIVEADSTHSLHDELTHARAQILGETERDA